MYKVDPALLKLCKENALLLRDLIIDAMQKDPSKKKELTVELKKVDKAIVELNKYPV